ncbi:MAG: ROK family protein [Abitibacteriaceae bacterium]|nr:ROK family protein [Abditibacteriaceae bacterium]
MMTNNLVAVDVGGTKILAAVLTDDGQIIARQKQKTERHSRKRLIVQIGDAVADIIKAASLKRNEIGGVALGVPGVVDEAAGYVVYTPNAPLSKTPLAALLTERFGLPVMIGNDVNLGVLGEHWRGATRGAQSAFGIFVGTGIGGGLVLDGKLMVGHRGLAGEIGHLLVPLIADPTANPTTNKHLYLEDFCSRTAIENQLRYAIQTEGRTSLLTDIIGDKKLERIRSGALKEALRRDDPLVTEVIHHAAYLLGLATVSVLHIVDPEVIIFGGGVIEACGKWMLPVIEKTARKVALPGTGKKLEIVRSALGDDAILIGGAALLHGHNLVPQNSPRELPPLLTPNTTSDGDTPKRVVAQVDKPLQI